MPRGGARPGAGRKPKADRGVVLGMNGARMVPPAYATMPEASAEAIAEALPPPADLTEKERAVWLAHAPLATEQKTLVPATVPGFKGFCQLMVHQAELMERINVLGRTSAEADRLVKRWEKGVPLLNAKLKDYKLTAFGKAEASAKKAAPVVNRWAQVSQK